MEGQGSGWGVESEMAWVVKETRVRMGGLEVVIGVGG